MKQLFVLIASVVLIASCSKNSKTADRDAFLGNYNFIESEDCKAASPCTLYVYSTPSYIVTLVEGTSENAVIVKNLENDNNQFESTVSGSVLSVDAGENTNFTTAVFENGKLKFANSQSDNCCTIWGEGTKF